MKLCWGLDGPIERNAIPDTETGRWALRDADGIDIADLYQHIFYADDEAGEIWHYTPDADGRMFVDPATEDLPRGQLRAAITKVVLGPGAFTLEWWPPGTRPFAPLPRLVTLERLDHDGEWRADGVVKPVRRS